jgi:predicted nucleic acid-binding protein
MVLVDTSIWVSFLNSGNDRLQELLEEGKVIAHPIIIGELACGNLKNRNEILSLLETLPAAISAGHGEVIQFIEIHRLMGLGLGYIDIHLLAAARLTGVLLWTADRNLMEAAARFGIAYKGE